MGRPSSYTPEMGDKICDQLIEGMSLRKICLAEDMPSTSAVCRWLATNDTFREQYARAREAQAETLADEILDIADDGTNDWMADKEAEEGFRYNGDAVQRSRLRVDSRKWLAAKMLPKKYGDSATVRHADADGEKLKTDDVAIVTRLAALATAIQGRNDDAADDAG
jgi:hypothetical protein